MTESPNEICGYTARGGDVLVEGYGTLCNYLHGDLTGNFGSESWTPTSAFGIGNYEVCTEGPSPAGSFIGVFAHSGASTALARQICSTAASVWFNY